jgi:hypothetical protein
MTSVLFTFESLLVFGDPLGEGRAEEFHGAVSGLDTGGIFFGFEERAFVFRLDRTEPLIAAWTGDCAPDEPASEQPPLTAVEPSGIAFRQRLERCAVAAAEAFTHVAPS